MRSHWRCGRAVRLARWAAILLTLGLLTPAERTQAESAAGRLAMVLRLADRQDWAGARRLAGALSTPGLERYLRWRELIDPKTGQRPPFSAYADFLRRENDWPSLGLLQVKGEEALDEAVPYAARIAFFADRAPRTRQGRIRLAEARIATGRLTAAVELVRLSWVGDDLSPEEEERILARFGELLGPPDHSARLDRLLWDGRIAQARRMLPRVAPEERLLALARLRLQLSDPEVEAGLAAVPKRLRRDAGLLFDRLRWRLAKGNEAGVREILLDPPEALGRADLWWPEQQRAIRAGLRDRSFDVAYRLAAGHRQPSGTARAEAEWLAGWVALRFIGRPQVAASHFERMWRIVGTPISRGRAAYWRGRAAAALDESEDAAAWYHRAAAYPTAFYGQLAARELGDDPRSRVGPAIPASAAARSSLRRRPPAQLAGLFCAHAQPGAAQPFFRHLGHEAAADRDRLRAVVELAEACRRPDLALTATRAAAGNGAQPVREAYPLPRPAIFQSRTEAFPEPALLMAVARQESQFDPRAVSPAGALGLMQLMPATAAVVARRADLRLSRAALLADPSLNVRLGALYLQQQLGRFGDEGALALAAYNAGPGRVGEWLELHGDPRGSDSYRLIDWIELIPFAETRNYVQRVLEGRIVYQAILAGPRLAAPRTVADAPPVPRFRPAS